MTLKQMLLSPMIAAIWITSVLFALFFFGYKLAVNYDHERQAVCATLTPQQVELRKDLPDGCSTTREYARILVMRRQISEDFPKLVKWAVGMNDLSAVGALAVMDMNAGQVALLRIRLNEQLIRMGYEPYPSPD